MSLIIPTIFMSCLATIIGVLTQKSADYYWESGLEYSSDSSYHEAPLAGEGRILMVPVGELEVTVNQVGSEG